MCEKERTCVRLGLHPKVLQAGEAERPPAFMAGTQLPQTGGLI